MLETVIDTSAVARNVAAIKASLSPGTQLMCVVKADAYGHGVRELVPVMEAAGADALGVATLAEARAVKESGRTSLPVLAWIWSPEEELTPGIDLAVSSLAQAKAVSRTGFPIRVYIKVETGMHRAGLDREEWPEVFGLLRDAPNVAVLGIMSHLACADEPGNPHNDVQAREFAAAVESARAAGLNCAINHLANTAATLTRPDLHFQMVRVGLGCYGLEPIEGLEHGLEPAMTWRSRVVAVKPLKAGEGTSYGLTHCAAADGFVANVPVGYADGLPRGVQGALKVGIGGKLYEQVGRVCMDQIVVDLGTNPHAVRAFDTAVIFGKGGMSATELANVSGTINYEIVCRPTGRTQRKYIGDSRA
ncbi:alanine racemase [Corynebacterium phocae]|uniref:Alanine racemase n=1 Tax=Corynebacterium phocae TaxID=161895 RepID=A0A1L7D4W9_9CORY|nr:alanine racemase [Corynebacterium phocae]APT93194.1 alanine racemase [Corynebacterium phocae]KAA8721931.1 alanine racemase [Corynebacterium phocae]